MIRLSKNIFEYISKLSTKWIRTLNFRNAKKNVAGTNKTSLIWVQIFKIQWIWFHKNGVFYFINKKMQIFSIWFVSLYVLVIVQHVQSGLVWFGLNVYRRFRVLILMDQLFHLTIFSHFMFYFQSVSVIINGWILSFVAKWFRTIPFVW